jgi:hypothetical protein
MRIGRISKLFSRGFGWCRRCHTTWRFVEPHVTNVDGTRGCFALCEKCWRELTAEERVVFYRRLFDEWNAPQTEWREIRHAVLTEEKQDAA